MKISGSPSASREQSSIPNRTCQWFFNRLVSYLWGVWDPKSCPSSPAWFWRALGTGKQTGEDKVRRVDNCSTWPRAFIRVFHMPAWTQAFSRVWNWPKSVVNKFMFCPIKFDKRAENCNFCRLNLGPELLVTWSGSIETSLDKSQLAKKSFHSVSHSKDLDNCPLLLQSIDGAPSSLGKFVFHSFKFVNLSPCTFVEACTDRSLFWVSLFVWNLRRTSNWNELNSCNCHR